MFTKSVQSFYISLFIFIISIIPKEAFAQQTKFDSIFYNTAVNVSGTDSNKALHIADSLYKHTSDTRNKVRALMLSADIYCKKGKINKGIEFALRANTLAEKSDDFDWVARISGFLSTQYRSTGLKSSGLRFLAKGMEASKKITNLNTSYQFQANAFQENAYYKMEEEQYEEALNSLNKADLLFKKLRDDPTKLFLLATNEELVAKNNFSLLKYDLAQKHYLEGLVYLEKASGEDSPLKGFIYDGLGKVSFRQKNYNQAHEYFLKAVQIAEKVNFTTLKIEVYQDLSNYYDVVKDMPKYKHYNNLYNQVVQSQIKENKENADQIVTVINKDALESSKTKNIYLYTATTVIGVLVLLFFLYSTQKKREKKKFQRIIKQLRERSLFLDAGNEANLDSANDKLVATEKKSVSVVPADVEQILIEKLRKFELGEKFTDNAISLSSLSVLLQTNSKYLSYVINNYKGKDFNTYINELRIFFIINKIEKNPQYLEYKISYLAEEAGFSSHSKFSAIFKSVVGLSPSVFLEQLISEREEKNVT